MNRPIPDDTRGIVDPVAMMRYVDFARFPPGDLLDGLVEWFWSVEWDVPHGLAHDQQILNHPAGNVSVGTIDDAGVPLDPAEGRVYGVMTGLSHRHLTGTGWTVAARSTVGGLGALLDAPAKSLVDRELSLQEAFVDIDAPTLVSAVSAGESPAARVETLRAALERVIAGRNPALLAEACKRCCGCRDGPVDPSSRTARLGRWGRRAYAATIVRLPRRGEPFVGDPTMADHRGGRVGP